LNFPAPLVRCGGRLPAGHHPAHACFPTRRSSDLPVVLGVFVGILSAIMGVGGGFVLVPAMVYLLRMPAGVVVGTSLFQIIITTSLTSVLQAGRNQTVDVVLATMLLVGGVLGAQFGARASMRFRAEELRALLALIVLVVGLKMGLDLFIRPADPFVLVSGAG